MAAFGGQGLDAVVDLDDIAHAEARAGSDDEPGPGCGDGAEPSLCGSLVICSGSAGSRRRTP